MAIRYRGASLQKLLSIVGASALIFTACGEPLPIVSFRASSSGASPSVLSGQSSPSRRTPDDSALQVILEPGTTSTLLEGTLDAGAEAEFVVSAEGGSVLMASVVGASAEVRASVYRIDTGEEIADAAPDQSFWIARVPETVGYLIVLQSRGVATDFRLTVGTPSDALLDMLQFSTDVANIDSRGTDKARTLLTFHRRGRRGAEDRRGGGYAWPAAFGRRRGSQGSAHKRPSDREALVSEPSCDPRARSAATRSRRSVSLTSRLQL